MPVNRLNQTLLVDPGVSFTLIEAALKEIGWQRNEEKPVSAPIVEGEPEFATWTWQGRKPFVIYTFNPVVKMRVLDVATVPPVMRGAIASKLSLMDERRVEQLFESEVARDRLLGLWAAQETQRLDLIRQADRLTQDPEAVLAEQARDVLDRLKRIDDARHEMLVNLRLLTEAAPQLIRRLSSSTYVKGLKPSEEELIDLFDENLKPLLIHAADAIYKEHLKTSPLEPDAQIEVFATTAGLLRWSNMLSDQFPMGYRDIAGWMNPKRIWMGWTVTTTAGSTVRYDGLAWLDDHWVWLPKIFRYLQPFLLEDPTMASHRH